LFWIFVGTKLITSTLPWMRSCCASSIRGRRTKSDKALEDRDAQRIKYASSAGKVESKKKTKHNPWIRWGAIAACFAVLVIAGAAILPSFFGGDVVNPEKCKYHISGSEIAVEWPWEYKTFAEKYTTITFNGKE
jgi:hypothetical protein